MREKFERFDKYMKYKGLNDNRVTVECGLSQGLLGQARKGKSDLGTATIDKILRKYQDLNRVWLLTGEGEMLQNQNGTTIVSPQDHSAASINGNITLHNGAPAPHSSPPQSEAMVEHLMHINNVLAEQNKQLLDQNKMLMERMKFRTNQLFEMVERRFDHQDEQMELRFNKQDETMERRFDQQDEAMAKDLQTTIDKCGTIDIDKLVSRLKNN